MSNSPEPPQSAEDELFGALEPVPGPPGYHADFYMPLGKPQEASQRVVLVMGDSGWDFVGPFEDDNAALLWASKTVSPVGWAVGELIRPEDWPGNGLEEPAEPETPLLDRLETP